MGTRRARLSNVSFQFGSRTRSRDACHYYRRHPLAGPTCQNRARCGGSGGHRDGRKGERPDVHPFKSEPHPVLSPSARAMALNGACRRPARFCAACGPADRPQYTHSFRTVQLGSFRTVQPGSVRTAQLGASRPATALRSLLRCCRHPDRNGHWPGVCGLRRRCISTPSPYRLTRAGAVFQTASIKSRR